MKELFFKALRWAGFVGCFVAGLSFLWLTSKDQVQWTFPALMCFGVVYWLGGFWRDMPIKTTAFTVFITALLSGVAYYLPAIMYILTNEIITLGFFWRWIYMIFFPGIPIMMILFKILD